MRDAATMRPPVRLLGIILVPFVAVVCGAREAATPSGGPAPPNVSALLRESWTAYVGRFIQPDGRVIDYRNNQITTSEGQAYAMLRAAWMEDRRTFDLTLRWAIDNLNRGVRDDRLWAWSWGRAPDGSWRVLDSAFAADGDEDAALALLVAWKTWGDSRYLDQARGILADLWDRGTVVVQGRRYLLGGDVGMCHGRMCRINPSYYMPYAYRIFARHDPGHDWASLVDTSYSLFDANAQMALTRLPSEWVVLDTATGALVSGSRDDSAYAYSAFRVHWRVALDAALYGEPRARRFLDQSLAWAVERWRREQRLPGIIAADGTPLADFESLDMLSGLMAALPPSAPDVAAAMRQRVQGAYAGGIWQDMDAYYLQNWAWFGNALYGRQLAPLELVR